MTAFAQPKIIFTDDQLLILDKSAGWLTHPSGRRPVPARSSDGRQAGSDAPAVTDWLITHYPFLATIGESERLQDGTLASRAGLLHRLDRETSGVLAVAKTADAFTWFTQAFRERTAEKTYRAIVSGVIKSDEGVIDLPIGRSRKDPRHRVAGKKAHGELRAAITRFRVLERFARHTYLELEPKTGRTHQLRAHLKAIQAPILGDRLYAPNEPTVPTISRTALHAYSLTLPLINGKKIGFEAPLPEDFKRTLDHLRQSC